MIKKIFSWFNKDLDAREVSIPRNSDVKFTLMVDGIKVGYLSVANNEWCFRYSEEFKQQTEYKLITGFSDVDKVYTSEELWPFFQIRIPGLKQPSVIETLEKENIDKNDEVKLLERFGKKSISNPYELVFG